MKQFISDNKILLILICISLVFCFSIIGTRVMVENENKTYDIVLDYQEIDAMAKQSKKTTGWWLETFKDMGITKVGLAEETLLSLMEGDELPVSASVMDIVTKDAKWEQDYPAEWIDKINAFGYDSYDVIITMGSKEAYDFVSKALLARYDKKKILLMEDGDGGYGLIDGNSKMTLYSAKYKLQNSKGGGFQELIDVESSKLMFLSLGMLPEKVEIAKKAGMDIIPRTTSYSNWNDTHYAEAVIADYEKFDVTPEYMIAGGESVIGYDDGVEFLCDYLGDNDITVGLIEDTTQLQNIMQYGIDEVTEEENYNTVRVFSVWNYIQYRYKYYGYKGAKEIENTLYRAVSERNIRLIYFKPIRELKDFHTYVTDVDEYKTMFENLENRLDEHGIKFGSASTMKPYEVPFVSKLVTALGCAFAGILLLGTILPMKRRTSIVLAAIGAVGVLGAFYVMPNTTELIAALASAMIFACLAVVFFTKQSKEYYDVYGETANLGMGRTIALAVVTLVVSVLISLIGGMMTAAPISSVSYMLEIDIFRGVKVAQLLPIAFFAVAYLAYFGFGAKKQTAGRLEFHDLKEMMQTPIRIWMIILGAIVLAGGYYYIMRTGHESVDVSSIEMIFRNNLEELLLARPRNKEFLFAFPAIMLMVYTATRRLKFFTILFGLCGVIGVTSVINTFMHIRTPLYLGFVRTGYSLLLGIIIGIIGILIFHGLYMLYKKLEQRYMGASGV